MPLTTARAWALLREHTAIFHQQLGWRYCRFGFLGVNSVPPFQLGSISTRWDDGARVRLACDLLNTLCACDGVGLLENPSFWRRVVLEWLLVPHSDHPHDTCPHEDHELPPFDAMAFSRFFLPDMMELEIPETTAFWRDFITCGVGSHETSAVETQQSRDALAQELAPHIVRPVRPLTIHFRYHVSVANTFLTPDESLQRTLALDTIQRCARDLDELRQASTTISGVAHQSPLSPLSDLRIEFTLGVTVSSTKPSDVIIDALVQTLQPFVDTTPVTRLECLEFFSSFCSSAQRNRPLRLAFHRMACALVRSVSFKIPLLVLNRSDECHHQYGALLSLVPHATVGALECDLGKTERLLRIAWLAYAVYHPKCRIESLTISSNSTFENLNCGEVQYGSATA